jgi:glutamate synthase (NADPH/NADH) large chain
LETPVLAGGHAEGATPLPVDHYRTVARHHGTLRLEDLAAALGAEGVAVLSLATRPQEPTRVAAQRLAREAVAAAEAGAVLLQLDDADALQDDRGWIPPHLALPVVDRALREAGSPALRRAVGLVVRSAALRNLHDIATAVGLGADAVAPYALLEVAIGADAPDAQARARRLHHALKALQIGLQKVTSTMGVHELRGYGRIFSGIGLSTPLAEALAIPNDCGSATRGLTWEDLDRDAERRRQALTADAGRLPRIRRQYPLLVKPLQQLARGEQDGPEAFAEVRARQRRRPVALRHAMDLDVPDPSHALDPAQVDGTVTGHDLPFFIASMSFGSQGEVAFRAYAEAARQLNILALNGEGGEIEDLMGRFPHNRGQQIASGRFGVNVNLLNASNLLEIKVGQGAKPGEGGHLPGRKVVPKVARARHVSPGIDLISPSNNHDIYSIEDLAQFIEELKTANPKARVAVKVPVVPGIGVIAVGIAKAGADIISLTGYDGGTGAARAHSLRHAGLPAEIGVVAAHRALLAGDMRHRVELWADGGLRSPDDVVKLMCLGANRVGFGTLAMLAIGCVLCRRCQTGLCRMGITTQIEDEAEAAERGVRGFEPRDFDAAVAGLVRTFGALGHGVKALAGQLGVARLQDLVGRADLLRQVSHADRLDLDDLLTPAEDVVQPVARASGLIPLRRPRNHLTTVVSNLVMEAVAAGESTVAFEDGRVTPVDRALGTHLAGALTRYRRQWNWTPGHDGVGGQPESWRPPVNGNGRHNGGVKAADLRFYGSSVPGNGLGAFNSAPITITVEGGAQDGVGKGLYGGRIVVLKGYNHDGVRIDGSVGKGLAYGAIRGLIIVQGNADSRACVRLSGADVVIGGEVTAPLDDAQGFIGARSNVKGFLCEYMTAGRVLVLGDPGPWMCAGMTGGVLYLHRQPALGLDEAALRRRIARGAAVVLRPVDAGDEANLRTLITAYSDELARNHQRREAERVGAMLHDWEQRFVKIVPRRGPGPSAPGIQPT